jgi:rhombotail lipoprotein
MMPHPVLRHAVLVCSAFAFAVLFSSCESMNKREARSNSVVNFLYPKDSKPLADQSIPVLNLPLRVGVAFIPPAESEKGFYTFDQTGFTEMQKNALMQKVRDAFKAYPFVQSIETIPSIYLRANGGFDNLDQLKGLLGIDVIVLLSYDQVQFTNDSYLTLAYWTIVGAYVVQGNKNDTHTLMEAAVYDIASRHLLFRAPGASQVKGSSTAIGIEAALREASSKGLEQATADLIKNLDTQLADFRERVKKAPEEVKIVHKPGYTGSGGGAFDALFASFIALFVAGRWLCLRNK